MPLIEIDPTFYAFAGLGVVIAVIGIAMAYTHTRKIEGWLKYYGFEPMEGGGWEGRYKGFVARIREEAIHTGRHSPEAYRAFAYLQLFDPRTEEPLNDEIAKAAANQVKACDPSMLSGNFYEVNSRVGWAPNALDYEQILMRAHKAACLIIKEATGVTFTWRKKPVARKAKGPK